LQAPLPLHSILNNQVHQVSLRFPKHREGTKDCCEFQLICGMIEGIPMMTRCWKLTAPAAILVLVALAAHAQEAAECPVKDKLTLDQVAGFIERKVPEERTVSLIESCHVSFSLNAAALDRLTAAGVSGDELQALNRETLALLTVEQAHDEVAGLEQYIADSNKAIAAERDAPLQKLNAEFQLQRAKAAHIEPRGEFETTQEFNARKQQAEAAVAALDRQHEEDTSRVTLQYQAKANTKARPFQARIAFLEQAQYPEAAKAIYTEGSYNPDTQLLPVTIGGEEYLFDNVPPATARQIITNWKEVTLARLYSDDEMKTRLLKLTKSQIAITGQSRQAKVAHMLDEAGYRAKRQDFDGARKMYQDVLALDPENRSAGDALPAMQQASLSQIVWRDPATGLMWPRKDNGRDVNWQQAIGFCRALTLAGYSDWRLPTIAELAGIYDRTQNVDGAGIKGGIRLTDWTAWSNSPGRASGEVMLFYFHEGTSVSYQPYFSGGGRALCVRSLGE
jgi:hypothetical protein